MARPKKAVPKMVAAPKEEKIVITKEQIERLRNALEMVTEARRVVDQIEEVETLVAAGFKAGKVYSLADKAEDMLNDVTNELDPFSYSDDEDEDDLSM